MADFNIATREAWDASFVNQVALALPIFAMLYHHRRVKFKGGSSIKVRLQKGSTESLTQAYLMNEPMQGGKVNVLEDVEWFVKYAQHPVQYDARDIVENRGGRLTAPMNTVKLAVDTSQDGFRRYMQSKFLATAATTPETEPEFNSVLQALTHDAKYGGLTRSASAGTNAWWQGASPASTYTDQATAASPSLANLLKWATVCRRYLPQGLDGRGLPRNPLYMFCPEGIYQELNSQIEGRAGIVSPSVMKVKYGFTAMNVHGVEIVQSSWMTLNSMTTHIVMMNPDTWQMRVAPDRAFKLTPFVWQGEQQGGIDAYLARILLAGNLTCRMPRGNMYLSSVA